MALSLDDRRLLNDLIDAYGIEHAWKSVLAARIRNAGHQYAYILADKDFAQIADETLDILHGLPVGEISALYEYALAYSDRHKRKMDGQFFTPDDVAKFLASHAERFSDDTIWIDPCSGVGNLSFWLAKREEDPELFIRRRLYLVDRDALALLTARVLFTIEFQKADKKLFHSIRDRFLVRDFLKSSDLPKYNAAILNPPYVSGVDDASFKTAPTKNVYAYFIEKIAHTCDAGYISITPQTFTNGVKFANLREVILEKHNQLDVYCFDNVPDNIFSGFKFGSENTNKANSTRAGVIVATNGSKKRHRITPLLRWRSHEREHLFKMASSFLTKTEFSAKIFPKLGRELESLYQEVRHFDRVLADFIVERTTHYALQVPTTPRYFISANKNPVSRTSFKTLYFASSEDLDAAYVILNSSYMYWWWRVNDGGMTISEKTLLELPVPELDRSDIKKFVDALERSEQTSKVVKLNAGKVIENVKHPYNLVRDITKTIFPQHADHLLQTHSNSHLSIQAENKRLFA